MRFVTHTFLIALLFVILSGCSENIVVLPENWELKEEKTVTTAMEHIEIYNLSLKSFELQELYEFPKFGLFRLCGNCKIRKWRALSTIDKEYINYILYAFEMGLNGHSENELPELLKKIGDMDQNLYFASLYYEMGDQSTRISESIHYKYILDLDDMKLYIFTHVL
jgi:hypothetical protein